ncbi:hypothetical protein Q9S36_49535 [Microbacterium sp. ARD31]|uniref:hypothetical protein n=1 Tax=Microbacterium sp. ARD31 TaxID=2962576 RepID=UPI002881A344|nr:hypothetical protein [Microbacterium sp. ARD31]MDT0188260.1 hypothetical protein [Microbacterium sp. ARD31]
MSAVHGLLVLLAFALASLVTYAVVLAALTATSAASDEPWLDVEEPSEDGGEVGEERPGTPVSC